MYVCDRDGSSGDGRHCLWHVENIALQALLKPHKIFFFIYFYKNIYIHV